MTSKSALVRNGGNKGMDAFNTRHTGVRDALNATGMGRTRAFCDRVVRPVNYDPTAERHIDLFVSLDGEQARK
jgi:hypothetical protein